MYKDILGGEPRTLFFLAKMPGMAFAASEIAPRLVEREIIFRPGEVNRGDEPLPGSVFMVQGCLAGQGRPTIGFNTAAPGFKSLLNQAARERTLLAHELPLKTQTRLYSDLDNHPEPNYLTIKRKEQ